MSLDVPARAGSRLGAMLLGLALVGLPAGLPVAVGAAAVLATEAAAQTRSSGGYSRPRSGGYGRTPSFGGPSVAPRTPSSSGGYGRPETTSPYARRPSLPSPFPSAGDRSFSREQSGDALARYRAQQDAARRAAEAARAPAPVPSPGGGFGLPAPGGGLGFPVPRGGYAGSPGYGRPAWPDWYRSRGWQPTGPIFGAGRSFGVWDGLFLWFLLDNLTRPGATDFFRNHRDDPGLREWRTEAERLARDNADLRARLDRLDAEVAARPDAPADPNYLPPGVPAEVAVAKPGDARTPTTGAAGETGGGWGGLFPVVVLGAGGLLFLGWRRRRGEAAGAAQRGEERGAATVGPLGTAGAMLRHKLSGERYAPSLFRVGMTVAADPAPFILAQGATKVPPPEGVEGGGTVGVQEVGRVESGGAELVRLYLPGRRGMFQLHLDAEGRPDECRWFGLIDEVTPADAEEWGVWLDPKEGLIGWPEFQTKDGAVYARAWAPGESRIAPRALEETIETAGGTRRLRSGAMLYARPTGAAAPAPGTEYLLVAAVEGEGRAWVEIHAGIDVNPASLQLA